MAPLRNIFGERIVSRRNTFIWPPRSPDLTAPDCFLWSFLKGKAYVNKPRTTEELKTSIRDEVKNITPEDLKKVMENVLKRARLCEA